MSKATAASSDGNAVGDHAWPWRSGMVSRNAGIRSLPIPVHPEVLAFLLGDLVGRKLRVSPGPVATESEPGRVTILVDQEGRIADMWIDPD